MKLGRTSAQLEEELERLRSEGRVVRLDVSWDRHPHYCLPEDADRLEDLLAGGRSSEEVCFFSYFDNLLWIRERVDALFDFEPVLELYVPKEKRRFGHYHLPIIYGDRFVGRLEPKMDRENETLIFRSYWHQPGFSPDEGYEDGFLETLQSFARFNGARDMEWVERNPKIG